MEKVQILTKWVFRPVYTLLKFHTLTHRHFFLSMGRSTIYGGIVAERLSYHIYLFLSKRTVGPRKAEFQYVNFVNFQPVLMHFFLNLIFMGYWWTGKIIGILFQKQCKRGQNSEFVQIWKAYRFFIFKPMLMIFFFWNYWAWDVCGWNSWRLLSLTVSEVIYLSYFSSNFNAIFCKMIIFMCYWWTINKMCIFSIRI